MQGTEENCNQRPGEGDTLSNTSTRDCKMERKERLTLYNMIKKTKPSVERLKGKYLK